MWTQNIVFQKILSKEKYNIIFVGTFMIMKKIIPYITVYLEWQK